MKIGLAQIDTTVGDVRGNADRVLAFLERAGRAGCGLVIFPELTLTGYPPRDLVEAPGLIDDNLLALQRVAGACRETAALVGFVDRNASPLGKPLHNAAALLEDGRVAAVYHKSLLPTYDVFDEGRYFEPGDRPLVFERDGLRFGVTICEDIWGGQAPDERRLYRSDPVDRLTGKDLDWLINVSASPFSLRKEAVRHRIAARLSGGSSFGVIYLNAVGGNDELVFDGASFVTDRTGRTVARAASFAEDLAVFDTDTGMGDFRPAPEEEVAGLAAALVLGLKDYVRKCGFRKIILGLSGGIDSSVTAVLAVRALGPDNVIGVLMPSEFTGPDSVEDASGLALRLGITTLSIPISGVVSAYREALAPTFGETEPGVAEENIQARIRGNLLMALSNKYGHMVITTGNKSELAVGYCTLYGDMSGGLAVIGDVPKTLVYPLGRHLNEERAVIPQRVFSKPPSAELRPGQRDDDSLPPYEVLDPILRLYIEDNRAPAEIVAAGFPAPLVRMIVDLVDRNEYKRRQAPPVLRVTSKAFGIGRRLPIAQKRRHDLGPE
jgi:NAD+ synthase (glutamine-hydrolysing)